MFIRWIGSGEEVHRARWTQIYIGQGLDRDIPGRMKGLGTQDSVRADVHRTLFG